TASSTRLRQLVQALVFAGGLGIRTCFTLRTSNVDCRRLGFERRPRAGQDDSRQRECPDTYCKNAILGILAASLTLPGWPPSKKLSPLQEGLLSIVPGCDLARRGQAGPSGDADQRLVVGFRPPATAEVDDGL